MFVTQSVYVVLVAALEKLRLDCLEHLDCHYAGLLPGLVPGVVRDPQLKLAVAVLRRGA